MPGFAPNYVSSSDTYVANAFFGGGAWKYIAHGPAYMLTTNGATGAIQFYTAAIGSAGAAITWNGPVATMTDAGAGSSVEVAGSLHLPTVTASRPAKIDAGQNVISGLINILSASDVVCGGTGFVTGAGSGAPSILAFGLTANPAFYGVQNGAFSFDEFVPITVATGSITYVDSVTLNSNTSAAVISVDFTLHTVTTDNFLDHTTSLTVTTATTPLVISVTTSECKVPALDSGHQTTKGLVET